MQNGSTQNWNYDNVVALPRKESTMSKTRICEVPNCTGNAVSHGLCDKHRIRLREHGDVNFVKRPSDWGKRRAHPMYEAWQSMKRGSRLAGGVCARWTDFWLFLEDMGERPSENHRLYRKDGTQPFSKENCEWRASILDRDSRATSAQYQQVYRMKRPRIVQAVHLKKKYGLTVEQFDQMLVEQGGVCAVCRKTENAKHAVTGGVRNLAVDHCHDSGQVRGLLCTNCNRGMGNFSDDVETLSAAIEYLEKHKRKRAA